MGWFWVRTRTHASGALLARTPPATALRSE